VKLKIRDLRVGDGVDLRTFPDGYPFDETTWDVAEFERAEVIGNEDPSMPADCPFVVESPTTWVLLTDAGNFGIDPDWEVEVSRP
jgi:hypothetical protein